MGVQQGENTLRHTVNKLVYTWAPVVVIDPRAAPWQIMVAVFSDTKSN